MDLIKNSSEAVTGTVNEAFGSVMSLSSEWLALISLVLLLFAYFLYIGKSKTLSFVIALYISSFAFSIFPYKDKFIEMGNSTSQSFWILFGLFIVFFLFINWIMRSIIWEDYPDKIVKKWFETGLLALVTTASIITILTTILNLEIIYILAEPTKAVFSGETSLFWSNIASLVVLFFVSRN